MDALALTFIFHFSVVLPYLVIPAGVYLQLDPYSQILRHMFTNSLITINQSITFRFFQVTIIYINAVVCCIFCCRALSRCFGAGTVYIHLLSNSILNVSRYFKGWKSNQERSFWKLFRNILA